MGLEAVELLLVRRKNERPDPLELGGGLEPHPPAHA
jgi:hypothetical protein